MGLPSLSELIGGANDLYKKGWELTQSLWHTKATAEESESSIVTRRIAKMPAASQVSFYKVFETIKSSGSTESSISLVEFAIWIIDKAAATGSDPVEELGKTRALAERLFKREIVWDKEVIDGVLYMNSLSEKTAEIEPLSDDEEEELFSRLRIIEDRLINLKEKSRILESFTNFSTRALLTLFRHFSARSELLPKGSTHLVKGTEDAVDADRLFLHLFTTELFFPENKKLCKDAEVLFEALELPSTVEKMYIFDSVFLQIVSYTQKFSRRLDREAFREVFKSCTTFFAHESNAVDFCDGITSMLPKETIAPFLKAFVNFFARVMRKLSPEEHEEFLVGAFYLQLLPASEWLEREAALYQIARDERLTGVETSIFLRLFSYFENEDTELLMSWSKEIALSPSQYETFAQQLFEREDVTERISARLVSLRKCTDFTTVRCLVSLLRVVEEVRGRVFLHDILPLAVSMKAIPFFGESIGDVVETLSGLAFIPESYRRDALREAFPLHIKLRNQFEKERFVALLPYFRSEVYPALIERIGEMASRKSYSRGELIHYCTYIDETARENVFARILELIDADFRVLTRMEQAPFLYRLIAGFNVIKDKPDVGGIVQLFAMHLMRSGIIESALYTNERLVSLIRRIVSTIANIPKSNRRPVAYALEGSLSLFKEVKKGIFIFFIIMPALPLDEYPLFAAELQKDDLSEGYIADEENLRIFFDDIFRKKPGLRKKVQKHLTVVYSELPLEKRPVVVQAIADRSGILFSKR